MAERARAEGQRERASARERRRASISQAFDALTGGDDGGQGNGGGPAAAAKQAARTAAAAAVAGGLAGAAKALVERRKGAHDEEHDEAVEQPRAEETHERLAEAPDEARDRDYGAGDETAPPPDVEEDDQQKQRQRRDTAEPATASPRREQPRRGGTTSEVADVAERARGHVSGLLGKEAETVSGISRADGSWTVMVEVVDVHRVPDSTDVLSSYEVVLDDDGGLLRLERCARYRRAQVEEGR
jgi:hypothetical protein